MGIAEIRKLKRLEGLYPKQVAAEKEFKVKMPKPVKAIPKKSKTNKFITSELKKLYPIFLAKHKVCEIQGPGCTGKATAAHHSEGRLPSKVLDITKWVACCAPCNLWCETHHGEAQKKGFKKSKF